MKPLVSCPQFLSTSPLDELEYSDISYYTVSNNAVLVNFFKSLLLIHPVFWYSCKNPYLSASNHGRLNKTP